MRSILLTAGILAAVLIFACTQAPQRMDTEAPVPQTAMSAPTPAMDPFSAIDRHALAAPAAVTGDVQRLAAYLVRPARNDTERARALFRWMTAHIAYDTEAFFSRRFRNQAATAESVLRSRRAVCDGYARLYQALGQAAGLEVERIPGYAKGFGYAVGESFAGESNHAWNAVRIDGQWRLLDATWGAGHVDADQRKFMRRFDAHYFLTPPAQLVASHLPEEERWQLLGRPVRLADFERAPQRRPPFFQHGLQLRSHETAVIEGDARLAVTLGTPQGTPLLARVYRGEQALPRNLARVAAGGGETTIHVLLPEPGTYRLGILTPVPGDTRRFELAMQYQVRARAGTRERFPRFGPVFAAHGWRLPQDTGGERVTRGRLTLTAEVPPDVMVTGHLQPAGGKPLPGALLVQREGTVLTVHAAPPRAGDYDLQLFSKRDTAANTFDFALGIAVHATAGAAGSFPETYGGFGQLGAVLHGPMEGDLSAGQAVAFDVTVPPADRVAVSTGGKWIELRQQGSRFRGEVTVRPGGAEVYARLPGESQYMGLLKYRSR